jgi:outer membrane protein TolC
MPFLNYSPIAQFKTLQDLSQARLSLRLDTHLQVVTSQTKALKNERNDTDVMRRQFEANALLVKALGGGWNVSTLPKL